MMHTLIVGEKGVGKSTLIARVVNELKVPLSGFQTKKEETMPDPSMGIPVYFYPINGFQNTGSSYQTENTFDAGKFFHKISSRSQSRENLLGYSQKPPVVFKEAFDRMASKVADARRGELILIDEIGFMETCSKAYCDAVLSLLDGVTPVIAAVKDREIPFLNTVRSHPGCRCFFITPENREELYSQVLEFVRKQLLNL